VSTSDEILERRIARERAARKQAESLLEEKSRSLFEANEKLVQLAESLERKVEERTGDLRKKTEEALAAARAKSVFLAMMSHEIRTPMNGVLGAIDLLEDTQLDAAQIELVATAGASAKALLGVIDDILDQAALQSGTIDLRNDSFDVRVLVQEVLEQYQPMATENRVAFEFSTDGFSKSPYLGDAKRVRQIIRILVSNAVKFTEDGGVVVTLSDSRESDGLRIAISDTGVGMTDSKIEHAFAAFAQLDEGNQRQFDGTGLGLSICRQLCIRMGGELVLQSEPGVGTRATVDLPLEKTTRVTIEESFTKEPETVVGSVDTTRSAGSQVSVLLVEDNPTNRKIQSGMLTKLGVKLDICENGEEAVTLVTAQAGRIDLVLMDAQMPVMDGYEATRKIRAWERETASRPLPIVALTANTRESDRQKCFAAGMDDFATKPTSRAALGALIKKWTTPAEPEVDGRESF